MVKYLRDIILPVSLWWWRNIMVINHDFCVWLLLQQVF